MENAQVPRGMSDIAERHLVWSASHRVPPLTAVADDVLTLTHSRSRTRSLLNDAILPQGYMAAKGYLSISSSYEKKIRRRRSQVSLRERSSGRHPQGKEDSVPKILIL